MQSGEPAWNHAQNFRSDFRVAKIDKLGAKRVGDGLVKTELIDIAAVDHGLRNGFSVELDFVQHVLGLRGLKHTLLDEKLRDLFVVH
jgi:hypothetical protein